MRRRRSSLILTFAAVSLLAMVVLAVGLVIACTTLLRKQALTEGTRTAETYVQLKLDGNPLVVEPFATTLKPGPRPSAARVASSGSSRTRMVDTSSPAPAPPLLGLRLWSRDGELFWDTDTSPPASRTGRGSTGARQRRSALPSPTR